MTVLLTVCFSGAVGILFLTTLYALDLAVKKHNLSAAYKALCLGTIITAVCYFIPFYCDYFAVTAFGSSFAKSFFLSVHHAIRLFFVDVNYDELRCFATDFGLLGDLYTSFGILLFILAPVLTFTFAVSFLQEASTVVRVWFSPRKDYYIFSEMNLQSVYLAKDIRMQNPDVNIVFLGVNKDDRSEYEQIKTYARSIHAVLLPTDCVQINSLMARYKRNAHFFLIGENEEENVVIAIAILEHTPHASKREIYVRLSQSDHLLDNQPTSENTAVFRVEHTYSLVVHNLEELDTRLFETATPDGNGDNVISVLVVGLGCCGTEM